MAAPPIAPKLLINYPVATRLNEFWRTNITYLPST